MNISGRFTTTSSVEALSGLADSPGALNSVSTLDDVSIHPDGSVEARFAPLTALGRFTLGVTIKTISRDGRGARLRVTGRQGASVIDVDLALLFSPEGSATTITWDADVVVRGTAASVGQRVAQDVARHVIADVLAESANVAGQRV